MKIWVDDIRHAPDGYVWCHSVNAAIKYIATHEEVKKMNVLDRAIFAKSGGWHESLCDDSIDIIDLDHDAGEYYQYGGDYIRLLDWLEETCRSYPIHIHSQNPVGVANMRRIIQRNGWIEVR